MKKIMIRIITIALIVVLFSLLFPYTKVFAGQIIKRVVEQTDYDISYLDKAKSIGVRVLTAIRNISIIATVIVISIIGVKYMVGSAEERAGYKKSLIPLAIGVIIVASTATIATTIFTFTKGVS